MDSDYIHGELYYEDSSFSTALFYQFHIDSNWAVAAGYQDTRIQLQGSASTVARYLTALLHSNKMS